MVNSISESYYLNDNIIPQKERKQSSSVLIGCEEVANKILNPKPENISRENAINKKVALIGFIVGLSVLVIAIIVTTVALTILSGGLLQAVLVASSISLMTGAASMTLASFFNFLKYKKNSANPGFFGKQALALGVTLTILGLALKSVAAVLGSPLSDILSSLGQTTSSMGFFSTFTSLCGLVAKKIEKRKILKGIDVSSNIVAKKDVVSQEDIKKQSVKITRNVLIMGTTCMILGIGLALASIIGGAPAIVLVFASPLMLVGTTLLLRSLIKFPWGNLKNFKSEHTNSEKILSKEKKITTLIISLIFLISVALLVTSCIAGVGQYQVILSAIGITGVGAVVPVGISSIHYLLSSVFKAKENKQLDSTENAYRISIRDKKIAICVGALLFLLGIATITLALIPGAGTSLLVFSVVGSSLILSSFLFVFFKTIEALREKLNKEVKEETYEKQLRKKESLKLLETT